MQYKREIAFFFSVHAVQSARRSTIFWNKFLLSVHAEQNCETQCKREIAFFFSVHAEHNGETQNKPEIIVFFRRLVQNRLNRLTQRIKRWTTLRSKDASERRVAVVLYGYPPGIGATGTAALLNVPKSLHQLLTRLKAEGYDVGEIPEEPVCAAKSHTQGPSTCAHVFVCVCVCCGNVPEEPVFCEISHTGSLHTRLYVCGNMQE